MTNLMEEAIDALRHIPADQQESLARVVLHLAGKDQPTYMCTPEEAADLDEANAEADRGEFAMDEQVRAIWAKYGL